MDITEWIWEHLDADTTLPDEAKYLVGAAVEGQSEFRQLIAKATEPTRPESGPDQTPPEPAKSFLKSIQVEGFRGIGQKSTLTFNPAPGLIVVAGRNGSGKSSFADGLQVALRQRSGREHKHPTLGNDQWRNIHRPDPSRVQAVFAVEGQGDTIVGIEWAIGAAIDDHKSWSQQPGNAPTDGLECLGWTTPLELFSPMLSYDELGGVFDGRPSELYDAIEGFLGLSRITDAMARLAAYLKEVKAPSDELKAAVNAAKFALADVDDDRVRSALAQIGSRNPDLNLVRALLAGSAGTVDPQVATLSRLAALRVPVWGQFDEAFTELSAAARDLTSATAEAADAGEERDELLLAALAHHGRHGDETCPVCGVGRLDEAWATLAQQTVNAGRKAAERRRTADARTTAAEASWCRLQPAVIPDTAGIDLAELVELREARLEWDAAAAAPLSAGLAAVESAHGRLIAATEALAAAADAEERSRQNRWAKAIPLVAGWLTRHAAAAAAKSDLESAIRAEKWLKDRSRELRNERLAPLAEQARYIWSKLRQESNVDLGAISLEGMKTTRKVALTGTVDGSEVGGLAVMSQGELHALALALFIPRATASESPFGFVILDDPIQAMDPSKVDGFVDVLSEIALVRQVIVFSHDDRLPDAIRRMGVPARVLEIVREQNSFVRARDVTNPVERYLKDASIIAREEKLSEEDRMRVIPGLCRLAIETACRDLYFSRSLSSGAPRHEVEAAWQDAHETRERLKLALEMDDTSFNDWLLRDSTRKRGLGVATSAFHDGLAGNPKESVQAAVKLVQALAGSAPKA